MHLAVMTSTRSEKGMQAWHRRQTVSDAPRHRASAKKACGHTVHEVQTRSVVAVGGASSNCDSEQFEIGAQPRSAREVGG